MDTVRLDVGGGRITATGSAGDALNIALTMEALPLSVANAVAPDLGLAGTLIGTAKITGTALKPNAQFDLTGQGINAAAIRDFGVTPLSFNASGSYAGNGIQLAAISAQGAGGLRFTGSGTVPLTGLGLDIRIEGSAPLTLANRFVADRGGQLTGGVTFNVAVSGNTSAPRVSGKVTIADAGYIDPELNLRLVGVAGNASLEGDRIVIGALSGNLATGGSVAVSGSIGLGAGFPADLTVRLNSARYADGELFVATVSGDLAVSGPIAGSPTLSGRVRIEKADIAVPETFGGNAALIDVRHIDPPRNVAVTLNRATVDSGGAPIPASRRNVLQLDVTVDAPNQVFIRGRGLDVEVGGSVRLTGPVDDIRPVGAFTLARGRLSILGQRLDFDHGEVTLVGDLDPFLNLVASINGDGLTAFVTVSGRVSDIDVAFTSQPQLPQDEVLARILFKRSMGELSPLQIARLAAAAAELAGGGSGNSLVDSLRDRAGLADLDIVTDANGNVAVQAGRYIQDNIYLGVQAGADGNSRVTVNLDITDNLKAKASTGINGESSVGVFYEGDY
jgi:translocation and assembly module TamB